MRFAAIEISDWTHVFGISCNYWIIYPLQKRALKDTDEILWILQEPWGIAIQYQDWQYLLICLKDFCMVTGECSFTNAYRSQTGYDASNQKNYNSSQLLYELFSVQITVLFHCHFGNVCMKIYFFKNKVVKCFRLSLSLYEYRRCMHEDLFL